MARKRAPGFEAQREDMLAEAARLFAQQGFSATSMNQVAEACGVAKPTLYHYFQDKNDLLAQICDSHVHALLALVEEVKAKGLAPDAELRALIERFTSVYADAQDQHRVLTSEIKFLADAERQRLLDVERRVVAEFAAALTRVRPELQDAQLHKPLTMLLFGMINWTFTWLRPDGDLSPEALASVVSDLFFGGLGAVQLRQPAVHS
ncbi:TetR/AcrR family transcriptional regulator [Roseateles puraquae]|jgi:TetR/AcrR family transcriptional regulator|uniref:TetR family transcriptional regulator n=1 Tax=Roseateles puraquae TaxID=431059 RepID=A0A254N799_9BURK|nr:TetR/AcrR family transcriptional regulator [Roseateles puraquae]MDG0854518.1 TetR/AcrR family transcriptional regulator [Roseateles puraquae]OWR03879.1 TetR family transcriptional regulator [Roseateles puraquae]